MHKPVWLTSHWVDRANLLAATATTVPAVLLESTGKSRHDAFLGTLFGMLGCRPRVIPASACG